MELQQSQQEDPMINKLVSEWTGLMSKKKLTVEEELFYGAP